MKEQKYIKKCASWQEKALNMGKIILKNSKEKPLKSIKTFFPKNFKEEILKEQKYLLLKAVKLYDGRGKIIKLFEDKYVESSNYSHNSKSEPEEFERKEYEESIA